MRRSRSRLFLVAPILIVAACAGDDGRDTGDDVVSTEVVAPDTVAAATEDVSSPTVVDDTGADAAGDAGAVGDAGDGDGGDDGGVLPEGFDVGLIEVTSATGEVCEVCVWLAADSESQSVGLMEVTDLGEPIGMLFAFGEAVELPFYMFNTPMPLSIAWFAADGAFVSEADMAPCLDRSAGDCERYAASGPYTWALEMPQGELADLGIGPGATLRLIDTSVDISDLCVGDDVES